MSRNLCIPICCFAHFARFICTAGNSFRKICLLTLFSFLSFLAYSQVNNPYEKGYVVTLAGDTLHGKVKYTREKELYSKIQFAVDGTQQEILYDPHSIYGYYLETPGQWYVSKNKLAEKIGIKRLDTSKLFIRAMVIGEASLYTQKKVKESYYLVMGNRMIGAAKGKDITYEIDGNLYNKTEMPFNGAIRKLFADCYKDSINRFSSQEFVRTVKSYNSCRGQKYQLYPNRSKKVWMGYVFGFSFSSVRFLNENILTKPYRYPSLTPSGRYDLESAISDDLEQFSVNFGVSFNFPTSNKHITLEGQPSFISRKYSSSEAKFEVRTFFLEIPLYTKYNFNLARKVQFFAAAGLNLAIGIASKHKSQDINWTFQKENMSLTSHEPKTLEIPRPLLLESEYAPSQIRLLTALGVDLNNNACRWTIMYRYEFLGSISQSEIFSTRVAANFLTLTATPLRIKNRN